MSRRLKLSKYWFPGVYYDPNCEKTDVNHAVLAVGYGVTPKGKKYWIVKNRWDSAGSYQSENYRWFRFVLSLNNELLLTLFSILKVGVRSGERRAMSWWLVTVTMPVALPAWRVSPSCETWMAAGCREITKGPNLSATEQQGTQTLSLMRSNIKSMLGQIYTFLFINIHKYSFISCF